MTEKIMPNDTIKQTRHIQKGERHQVLSSLI